MELEPKPITFNQVYKELISKTDAEKTTILKSLDADTDRKILELGLKCFSTHTKEPEGAAYLLKKIHQIQESPPPHKESNIFQQFVKWFQNTFGDRVSSQKLLDQLTTIKNIGEAKIAIDHSFIYPADDSYWIPKEKKAEYKQNFMQLAKNGDANAYLYLARLESPDGKITPAAIEFLKKGAVGGDAKSTLTLILHFIHEKQDIEARAWMEVAIKKLPPRDLLECVKEIHRDPSVFEESKSKEVPPEFQEIQKLLADGKRGDAKVKLENLAKRNPIYNFQLAYEEVKDQHFTMAELRLTGLKFTDEISNFCLGKGPTLLYFPDISILHEDELGFY